MNSRSCKGANKDCDVRESDIGDADGRGAIYAQYTQQGNRCHGAAAATRQYHPAYPATGMYGETCNFCEHLI